MALYLCSGLTKKKLMHNMYANSSWNETFLSSWSAGPNAGQSSAYSVFIPLCENETSTGKESWITSVTFSYGSGLPSGASGTSNTTVYLYAIDKSDARIGGTYIGKVSVSSDSYSGGGVPQSRTGSWTFLGYPLPLNTEKLEIRTVISGPANSSTSYIKNLKGFYMPVE